MEGVAISPQGEVYLVKRWREDSAREELWVYDSYETLQEDQPKTVIRKGDHGDSFLLKVSFFFPSRVLFGGFEYSNSFHPWHGGSH